MMRISTQWFIGGGIALLCTVFMMFVYARKVQIDKFTEINVQEMCSSVSLKGSFKETRQTVFTTKEFVPMKMTQNQPDLIDYKAKMRSMINKGARADDTVLIDMIKNYYIERPSNEPYNLDNPDKLEYSNGQTPFIDSRLNYIEGGFYVECGALNGEKGSNSLFFEKVRKWNGLLIEADPSNYHSLKSKNRKAFTVNACLSPRPVPAVITFNKAFNMGRAVHDQSVKQWIRQKHIKANPVDVECFPFSSLMLALNRTTIDFFSLDVEGDELNVLRTIPFEQFTIKMLAVEYIHGAGGPGQLQKFMKSKGYETLLKMQRDDGGVNDLIFRKKGLKH